MEHLVDLGLPALVFIGLCVWLVRKAAKAARTEGDLEGNRLQGALAEELQAARLRAAAVQRAPLSAVPDVAGGDAPTTAPGTQPTLQPVPQPTLQPTLQPALQPVSPFSDADLHGANPEHLPLIAALVSDREAQLRSLHPAAAGGRVEVLWVRSNATHCAWCERRHAASPAAITLTREVICVAQIDRGKVIERWFFG